MRRGEIPSLPDSPEKEDARMTIIDAINLIDSRKPNVFTRSDKIRWLSQCDYQIQREVVATHEPQPETPFSGYDGDTSDTMELIAPAPYDELYVYWLEAQMDYANAEYARYNNSISQYNNTFAAFANWYNRSHTPKSASIVYF